MPEIQMNGIEKDIMDLLYGYVKVNSNTGTRLEHEVEGFLTDYLSSIPYFQRNKNHYGLYRIENDLLERAVCWALVKGEGQDTVVLIHHSDVVDIEDFKHLKPLAYSPEPLEQELLKIKDNFSEEIQSDLESGAFLYGRGMADMKSGGAIQLALLKRYSELEGLKGNILLIAVPDEENLSAGMRGAAKLLDSLRNSYGLKYKIMFNSEPHLRSYADTGVFSEGSVGKLMPFVYARGYLSHVGKVFEGFNPVRLMSEIARRTDLNMGFSDFVDNEASPPPTWLYFKDGKKTYDVSLPLSMFGCLSVLTLNKTPGQVMELLNNVCEDAFETVINEMNASYRIYKEGIGEAYSPLPWKPKVVSFRSLFWEAAGKYGDRFQYRYNETIRSIREEIAAGRMTMLDGNYVLVEAVYEFIDDLSPRIVTGLTPPYYPNVSNRFIENLDDRTAGLSKMLKAYASDRLEQKYTTESYFKGISDMSYTWITSGAGGEISRTLEDNMPFFGTLYDMPIEAIERISMPCMNIGPWGKDFHKLTERVCAADVVKNTPELLHKAISYMLD